MKRIIIIIGFLLGIAMSTFSTNNTHAALLLQDEITYDEDEVQTVFSMFELKRISGFGGPTLSFTTIAGEFVVLNGGGGGVIINNMFLGGYGESTSSRINSSQNSAIKNTTFNHGGFWLGYEIMPEKVIHPIISTRLGWGAINGELSETGRRIGTSTFVVSPNVSAEINFTRFFKLNVGIQYRHTFNVTNMEGFNDADFSGLGAHVGFIFGWF